MTRDERIRLFVALSLPPDVARALAGWGARAVEGQEGLRALSRESLHVTLCFLGWQDADASSAIVAACEHAASGPPAPLAVAGARWLPARRPRVLAVDLLDGDGALAAIQGRLSNALHEGGWYRPERRAFLAHVTVARVGRRAPRVPPVAPSAPPPELEFLGDTVTVYRSRLSSAGASYEVVASVGVGAGTVERT